jgi:hypothetical protein
MKKYIIGIAYLCVTLFCLYELQWLITQPRQYQFLARQLDTIEVQIRALETNPQGDEFRWLSDDVTITVPKPTQTGIVHMHVWIAPGRVTTAIQVGNYRLTTPLFLPFQSRRIAILTTPSGTQSSLLPIKFIFKPNETTTPIAWAFAGAYWSSITAQPDPQPQLTLFVIITLAITTLTLYRISNHPLTSITFAGIGVLMVLVAKTPISATIGWITDQPALYNRLWVLAIVWLIWFWKYPKGLAFLTHAPAQARVVFVAYGMLTLIPVIGMIAPPESANIQIEELRKLQECPDHWTGAQWDVAANFAPLAQCVTDHIGWRSTFIRVKNEIDYQVFGVSSRIYFGHNGFYFMRRWSDERFPWLQEILQTPSQRQKLLATLQQINQNYAKQGIHVIMVIAPSKEFIYPENLPWNAPKYDYQMVRDFENDMAASGLDVIHTFDLLQSHKKDVPLLYHPRDFHWNDLSAYYVARAVTDRIAKHQKITNPWNHPLNVCSMFRKASDQSFAALLSNRNVYSETYCQITTMPNNTPWIIENRFDRDFNVWRADFPSPSQTLGALEIDGDSYSMYFQTAGLERYFNQVVITKFANWHDAFTPDHLGYLQRGNVRYVVWQMRDASLPLLLNDIYNEY